MTSFSVNLWTKNEELHNNKFEFSQKDIDRQNTGQQFHKIQVFSILGCYQHFCHNLPQIIEN